VRSFDEVPDCYLGPLPPKRQTVYSQLHIG
jgi:hypothetical protein